MPGAWSADAQPDGCAKKPLTYWIHKRIRLLWGIFTRISAEPLVLVGDVTEGAGGKVIEIDIVGIHVARFLPLLAWIE